MEFRRRSKKHKLYVYIYTYICMYFCTHVLLLRVPEGRGAEKSYPQTGFPTSETTPILVGALEQPMLPPSILLTRLYTQLHLRSFVSAVHHVVVDVLAAKTVCVKTFSAACSVVSAS